MDVLVGYATAHGSTRTIAARMASVLSRAGLTVDTRPMEDVEDADAYRAFVLGSAVHGQSWLLPARRFVRDNLDVLGRRPVWIFSVGMPAALRGPWRRLAPRELPAVERGLPPNLGHRDHRLFSGTVGRDQLSRSGTDTRHGSWPDTRVTQRSTSAQVVVGSRPSRAGDRSGPFAVGACRSGTRKSLRRKFPDADP
ncbi:flavodoxin domain-containing protein [Streptomyces griseoincarnatus]